MRLHFLARHHRAGCLLATGVFLTMALTACQTEAGIARPAAASRSADCRDSDPVASAERFYQKMISERVRGLPSVEAMTRYAPMLSQTMRQAIEQARVRQQAQIAAHPDEKPNFIEGDLFTSLFEGPTGVEGARVVKADSPVEIAVSFVMDTPYYNTPTRWTDVAVLRCEQGDWRVDDVRYGGKWDFAPRGSLVSALVTAN